MRSVDRWLNELEQCEWQAAQFARCCAELSAETQSLQQCDNEHIEEKVKSLQRVFRKIKEELQRALNTLY
jgi:hypothetical protein